MCVCSFRYPACKAHSPYFDLWPVWLYLIFSTLSHKRHDIRGGGGKRYWTSNVCFDFPTTFVWNISHFKKNWVRYKNVYWSSCTVPLILVRFQWNLNFRKILRISNFMKIGEVGAELFHADWRTDRHNNRFSPFFFRKRLKADAVREGSKVSRACWTRLIKYILKLLLEVGKCRVETAISEKTDGI